MGRMVLEFWKLADKKGAPIWRPFFCRNIEDYPFDTIRRYFLNQIDVNREVIAISTSVSTICKTAVRISFVTPSRITQIVFIVNPSFVVTVRTVVVTQQRLSNDDLIKKVPAVSVSKRTDTFFEHRLHRIVQAKVFYVVFIAASSQVLSLHSGWLGHHSDLPS